MKKRKCFISIFLILVGISIFLYPKISNYLAEKNQVEVIKNYRETIYNVNGEQMNLEYEKAKKYNESISTEFLNYADYVNDEYGNILNLSNNGIMSYIEIPKISSILPIYHGTADEVMKKGVGHLENTSLPIGGKSTHCVLTGHTGLLRAEIFTRLSELEVNDYFYINTLGKKLVYQIYQVKVVLPTETKDLEIVEEKDLVTLVTCTPYGVNTHRLLVQGERVEEEGDKKENFKENMNLEKSVYNENDSYDWVWILCGIMILLIVFLVSFFRNRGVRN